MREKKRSNKNTRCNEVRLKMPTTPGLSTSNNLGWAETLKKKFYTCRTWSLIQKENAKPIGNKSDNTLKEMSENTLKIRSEWQHTQERWTLQVKKGEHYSSRKVSTTSQNSLKVDQMIKLWE
jgi:hypothetical protein